MSSVVGQIAVLEREQARLEGLLTVDRNWRALQELRALNGSGPADSLETELRLKRLLAGNPYYAARLKIVEAVTILRRLRETAGDGARPACGHGGETGATSSGPIATPLGVPLFGEVEKSSRPILIYGAEATEIAPAPSASEQAGSSPDTVAPAHALTAIRNITPERAAGLARLGVSSLTQIADWTAADVKRVSEALGLRRTISKENWIEQAALLDRRTAAVPALVPGAGQGPAISVSAEPDIAPLQAASAPAAAAAAIEPSEPVVQVVLVPLQEVPCAETPAPAECAPPIPEPVSPRDWLAQRRRAVAQLPHSPPVSAVSDVTADPKRAVALDLEIGSCTGAAFIHPGEAEVTIATVKSGASSPGASAASSLRSRLRPPVPASPEFDRAAQARFVASGADVEEATIQFVGRRTGESGGLKSAFTSAIPDSGRVSRFLSALKGSK